LLDIYWLADGLAARGGIVEVDLPRSRVVRRVRLSGSALPPGVAPDDGGLGRLGLNRGVVHAIARSRPGVPVEEAVEAARLDLVPLVDLVGFAQRRAVVLRDAVAVAEGVLRRLHEPREPALSPEGSYRSLVDWDSLGTFLRSGIRSLRAKPREDRASFLLALGFHRAACAQRALIHSRLVEHLSGLDILATFLVGKPRRVQRPQSEQLEHWKAARQHLLGAHWPARRLPRPASLGLMLRVRNDLAHARLSKTLKPTSHERNRRTIRRATEVCVTLLEACALEVLGLGPSGPRLLLALPFRFGARVQRVWIGQ